MGQDSNGWSMQLPGLQKTAVKKQAVFAHSFHRFIVHVQIGFLTALCTRTLLVHVKLVVHFQ